MVCICKDSLRRHIECNPKINRLIRAPHLNHERFGAAQNLEIEALSAKHVLSHGLHRVNWQNRAPFQSAICGFKPESHLFSQQHLLVGDLAVLFHQTPQAWAHVLGALLGCQLGKNQGSLCRGEKSARGSGPSGQYDGNQGGRCGGEAKGQGSSD